MSGFARRIMRGQTVQAAPQSLTHGQQVNAANTGRNGAVADSVSNYSAVLTTLNGTRAYSTTQTIRNTKFTGYVEVRGGTVTFEFCQFTYQPAAAGAQVRLYNDGSATGTAICNWCDFDTGLSGGQGNFETTCFQAGERGGANPGTTSGAFALYRCHLTGAGNIFGMHQFYAGASTVTECYLHSPTNGGGTHPDGMEIYSSNNLTVQRCRVVISAATDQSCLNVTRDFGDVPVEQPVIVQDSYIDGGTSPILTRAQGGTALKMARYMGNYFGDNSAWGRECDFNSMDVTYNLAYSIANPGVIYWSPTNVWAPNGENIGASSTAPSGDTKAGLPHTYGSFIDSRNFYGGEVWIWNGTVVGPAGP